MKSYTFRYSIGYFLKAGNKQMPTVKENQVPGSSPAVPVAPRLIMDLQHVSLIDYKKDSCDREHKCNSQIKH